MRAEIRQLQQQLKITALYVTHDQEEALAISDRIAVMQSGRIEQVGEPEAIYRRPATPFVAQFMGTTNLLTGTVAGREGVEVQLAREGEDDGLAVVPGAHGATCADSASSTGASQRSISCAAASFRRR